MAVGEYNDVFKKRIIVKAEGNMEVKPRDLNSREVENSFDLKRIQLTKIEND